MDSGTLADLIRAVALLQPEGRGTDQTLIRSLRRMIAPDRSGARSHDAAPLRGLPGIGTPIQADRIDRSAQRPTGRVGAQGITAESDPGGAERGKERSAAVDRMVAVRSLLQLITERADLEPDQKLGAPTVTPGASAAVYRGVTSIPVAALFPASRVRAILREMSTVPAAAGEPDLHGVVKQIASGEPIRVLPRRLVSALPHAIHWLFEAGPSMLPFARDKQQLAFTAARLLGEDRTRIGDFIADPRKGVRQRGQVRWTELRWPARCSALVVVSDLGIGEGSDEGITSVWWPFLDEAVRRGVNTVLLNPYAQDRWPQVATDFDVSLTWDTGTGVQKLRRSKRMGRRAGGGDV